MNDLDPSDVARSLGTLYDDPSSNLRGLWDITVTRNSWSVNGLMALGILFNYFSIPFVYLDMEYYVVEFPFKIGFQKKFDDKVYTPKRRMRLCYNETYGEVLIYSQTPL